MILPITAEDPGTGLRSGVHPLDDYFARHALPNDRGGVSRCFVLRPGVAELPEVCGYYTLSMAYVQADVIRSVLKARLPKYPLPVALIGRLAVDERARGRRSGEDLLIDALARAVGAGENVGCVGLIVDAEDTGAERFYTRYDFVTVEAAVWPQRMFLPMATARAAARAT